MLNQVKHLSITYHRIIRIIIQFSDCFLPTVDAIDIDDIAGIKVVAITPSSVNRIIINTEFNLIRTCTA